MYSIKKKQTSNLLFSLLIFLLSSLSIVALITIISMIFKEAIPAYKSFGFFKMYFGSEFSTKGSYGIWSALLITLLTSIAAIIIALPLSLRAAFFIRFRVKRKKIIQSIINLLAGIPSVVFGIFALKSLNSISSVFSNSDSPMTLANAILMLAIMLFPTMTSLIYNQLKLIDSSLISSTMALGNTKTYAIYKTVKKNIRPGIYVAVITGLGRAIGETMALSMILVNPSNPIHGSFSDISSSSFSTLGVEISRRMFQDGSNPEIRSALFAAGIALFFTIMILIAIINKISKKRILNKTKFTYLSQDKLNKKNFICKNIYYIKLFFYILKIHIHNFTSWFIQLFHTICDLLILPINKLIYPKRRQGQTRNNYFLTVSRHKLNKIPDIIRIFFECLCTLIIIGSSLWIVLDVLINGVSQWKIEDWKFASLNDAGKQVAGDIMNPLIWTLILIQITILIAAPFSIATAIYLSEYARNKRSGRVIKFFLDTLGGTPSILFGIFGVILFLETFNLRNGVGSTSLIAGALTMVFVIMPTFTRAVEQVLVRIPDSTRMASYALGASKFETIYKVILPQAWSGIASGIILSIGRVISETAPIYLTLGMFAGTQIGVLSPGHTITTDILKTQIFSSINWNDAISHSYKLASVAIIFVSFIVFMTMLLEKTNKKVGKYASK